MKKAGRAAGPPLRTVESAGAAYPQSDLAGSDGSNGAPEGGPVSTACPGESIPFALSVSDQRLYKPRNVPLGKHCGCTCPGCRQPVYAKHCMSGKRAPHFAHAPGSDCTTGVETALHLAAKQLIEARAVLAFPELIASIKIIDDTGHVH